MSHFRLLHNILDVFSAGALPIRTMLFHSVTHNVSKAHISLSYECWSGERDVIQAEDIVGRLVATDAPPDVLDLLREHPLFGAFVE